MARRLLEDYENIIYTLELEGVDKDLWKKEIFERASRDLKIFIVRNLKKEEEMEEIRKKLILRVKEIEERKVERESLKKWQQWLLRQLKRQC